MEITGQRAAKIRESMGLTHEEMAGLLGVSSRTIYRWEHSPTWCVGGAEGRLLSCLVTPGVRERVAKAFLGSGWRKAWQAALLGR